MGPEDGRGRLLKAPDAPVGDEVFIENVGMAGCLEASDTIEKELASPRYPEVTAAGCAIPYGLTEQGCATIEMEAPEATGLFPQSTEEFAEVSATRSERSELQGVAEAGVPKPMREPKKKAKKARKRETKVEANAKATEAVEAERCIGGLFKLDRFGQAEIKVEVAEPIKAKEGCIYRIENAGALVQAERKSIARGALDVIPKGSTLTGELVPGIFEEGDRVEIKDDSKTFKKVTFGKICGKLLEATIVRKCVKEEDPRLVVRLTFTFGTLHGTFDQSELEPERTQRAGASTAPLQNSTGNWTLERCLMQIFFTRGEEVEGWLQKDGQWVMISSGVHEGLYIPRGNLRGEDTGSVLARYRFAEDMPKDSAYAAALVMWCVYRSSGWSTQCRSYFWSAVVMYTVSIILQGCLLALLVYVPLLSSEGGDPAACMYGIGAADSLFFPTGYGLTAHVGRGYEGFNVTTENRETDFARYELQVATHGALKSIIGLIAGMTGNESFHETAVNSISSLDPAADGKVFGIETHLFRFLGIFIFVVQWSRDFWTSVIHFYLLPPSGKGLGSASWIHTTREEVSLRFAGYHRADAKVFIVLGVFSMAISVYTVWLGVAMLLSLTTAEDVLLNCLALNFILDIDEIVFRSFAPIGVQKTLEEIDFEFYDQARVLLPSVVVELSLNWKTALAVLLAALCSHQVAEAPMALVGARFFRDFAVSRLGTLAYRSPLGDLFTLVDPPLDVQPVVQQLRVQVTRTSKDGDRFKVLEALHLEKRSLPPDAPHVLLETASMMGLAVLSVGFFLPGSGVFVMYDCFSFMLSRSSFSIQQGRSTS
ncbi:unnamed protein product [Durusdinium trenchii]|uniref:Uncharacterized protein n=1 Tax=Durusdinium trenchii TaxID=1381693 RepID=A0ABP0SZH0_9DINO